MKKDSIINEIAPVLVALTIVLVPFCCGLFFQYEPVRYILLIAYVIDFCLVNRLIKDWWEDNTND